MGGRKAAGKRQERPAPSPAQGWPGGDHLVSLMATGVFVLWWVGALQFPAVAANLSIIAVWVLAMSRSACCSSCWAGCGGPPGAEPGPAQRNAVICVNGRRRSGRGGNSPWA
jgi:hypothetical protein